MRCKFNIVFILIFLGVAFIFYHTIGKAAQQKDKPPLPEQASERANEVKLEKIKEVIIDKDVIDYAVGHEIEKKTVMINGKKVEVEEDEMYPKVVVTKKAVKFMDKAGNVKKEYIIPDAIPARKYVKVRLSKNKKYIAIIDFEGEGKTSDGYTMPADNFVYNVKLYDDEGNILIEATEQNKMLKPNISPNGEYFVSGGGDPDWEVSNAIYRKGRKYDLFTSEDLIYGGSIVFTEDGEHFIAHGKMGTYLLDGYGNKVQTLVSGRECSASLISKDMKYIVGGCDESAPGMIGIAVFEVGKGMLWKKQIEDAGISLAISEDNEFVVVTRNFGDVMCFNIYNGDLLWHDKIADPDIRISGAFASDSMVLITGSIRGYRPSDDDISTLSDHLFIYNKNGKLLLHDVFDGEYFMYDPYPDPNYPQIKINKEGYYANTTQGPVTYKIIKEGKGQ